jgi:uncharacterized protein DUF6131
MPGPRTVSWPRPAGPPLRTRDNPSPNGALTPSVRATSSVSIPDDRGIGWRMITVGIVLLVLGLILSAPILWTIGVVLVLVGAVLWILGATGRAVGGRNHYW